MAETRAGKRAKAAAVEKSKENQAPATPPYAVRDFDAFARNLARVVEEAGHAAAAWLAPREEGKRADNYADAFGDITKTLSKVAEYWLKDPQRALQAQTHLLSRYLELWNASILKAAGEKAAEVAPTEPGDRRFADPEWHENPFFDMLRQAYLITARWAEDLVARTEGLDEHTRHKAIFYTQQLINTLSPSNFPGTNPEVLRDTFASDAENLVRGMKMLAEDITLGQGDLKLRQSDGSKFVFGRDVANTPGKVISRNDVCEVIQYEAATEKVLRRPLVIVPPWINKFYILDLNAQKSFIRWCANQGHTVFVVSWINPDARQAGKSFEHYAEEGIVQTLDVVRNITGRRGVNVIGYCVGGTLLAVTLALLAKRKDDRVKTATFFTTQVDFTHAGDLKVFVDEEQIANVEESMATKGYLEGARMATAFNMLRSRDLIWPYVINNYLRGKEPMPFDLLYWNSDSTRMPAANHSFYMRNCYLENRLTKGTMELAGERLNLKDVTVPIYNLATREDHIAPAKSVFVGCKFFGGPVTYVMSGSGHIAGVINPPDAAKYQYWADGPAAGEFEDWLKKAQETPGSWWPHWHQWIRSHDDREVEARPVGSAGHPPIEDAPGSYVRVKS